MIFNREAYFDIISGKRTDLFARACRVGLSLLEMPYSLVIKIRNFMFDKGLRKIHKLDVPVISVGNLTVGGTGKTPFVAWLAQKFLDEGKLPAIVSRGYHADETGWNDEAKELKLLLPDVPQAFSKNRFMAAQRLLAEYNHNKSNNNNDKNIDVIILDDGFQHRKLYRDKNILIVDATNPFGYDRLMPRGLLRESISGIRRTDVVVLSRSDRVDDIKKDKLREIVKKYSPNAFWQEITHTPRFLLFSSGKKEEIQTISGQSAVAFCGLGNPGVFFQTVEDCGCRILDRLTYPDHYIYTKNDLRKIVSLSQAVDAQYIICSLKDFVKIQNELEDDSEICAIVIDMKADFLPFSFI